MNQKSEPPLALAEPKQAITPMELIQSAIMQGAGIDTIERLAKLQREMIEHEEKVAWHAAMHRVQEKMRPIAADMNNPQTKSRYASYAALDKALRPLYSAEGFDLSFNTAESHMADHVRVLCDVSRGGYSRRYQIDMPNDGKGAKGGDVLTRTHATGAAGSYGMRYLLKMVFNVSVGEDDRDGNGPKEGSVMTDERFIYLAAAIEDAPALPMLQQSFAVAWKEAKGLQDKNSMAQFQKKYDARKESLR